MTVLPSKLTRTLVGTLAAGAMAATTATPAFARDRHDDGIDAGDIIAGALVIGGIAAVASAAGKDNDRYGYGYRYGNDYRYDRAGYGRYGRGGSRQAVEQCVYAAERDATRYARGRADVTRVTSVERKRDGYNVRGRIALNDRGYGNRWGYNDRYDRYRGGYGYDNGSFNCKVRFGRIVDIDYSGIRQLR